MPCVVSDQRFNCITKFAFATSTGHSSTHPNKPNQDVYIIEPNLKGHLGLHVFGICDGHGFDGHKVSEFIKLNYSDVLYKLFPEELI